MPYEERSKIISKKRITVPTYNEEKFEVIKDFDINTLKNTYKSKAFPIIETINKYFNITNKTYSNKDIDLDFAARFVLGKYWRQMTDAQKEQYVPLFKRYVAALYKSVPLNIDTDDIHFTIDKVVETPKGMEVWCTIQIKKIEQAADQQSKGGIKVLFTLVENNAHIQVRDLKVEESSLLISYRDRFYKMIHQDSDDELEWFLEDFEALVQDTEQKNEEKLERL